MKMRPEFTRKEITMPSIEQALDNYLATLTIEGKSPEYTAWLRKRLKDFIAFKQSDGTSVKVSQITLEDGRAFIKYLMERKTLYPKHKHRDEADGGLAMTTIHGYVRAMRSFFAWLHRDGHTEENIFIAIKPPHLPKVLIQPLTESEIRNVLLAIPRDTLEGIRNYAITLIFLDSGIRLSELIGLKLSDVNFGKGEFKVFGKGSKERLVPLGEAARRALIRYIEQARPDPVKPNDEQVFLTVAGYKISKDSIEKIFQRLAKRTNIPRLHPHLLRHTFAVRYLINGGDVFSLQKILGHESLEMTRHYVELANTDVKKKHQQFSPMDNLGLDMQRRGRPKSRASVTNLPNSNFPKISKM
jgi:site-specific recombinase XerD